jgi:hypothetical protein
MFLELYKVDEDLIVLFIDTTTLDFDIILIEMRLLFFESQRFALNSHIMTQHLH